MNWREQLYKQKCKFCKDKNILNEEVGIDYCECLDEEKCYKKYLESKLDKVIDVIDEFDDECWYNIMGSSINVEDLKIRNKNIKAKLKQAIKGNE